MGLKYSIKLFYVLKVVDLNKTKKTDLITGPKLGGGEGVSRGSPTTTTTHDHHPPTPNLMSAISQLLLNQY